ncbi:MAG: cytochrome c-type biogenesis protein CcmH [Wenzhouxiangellaceae bacterium]|nr:MAG: cytochrome c-type biogenesis protein CcmH [Wenzhouxiangellaceae bacterium]
MTELKAQADERASHPVNEQQQDGVPRPVQPGRMSGMITPIEPLPFRSPLEERRFRALVSELRCTVCQNESLAESTAPLARDLRMEVFAMLQDGRSDMEIRQFMVDRYGDFVLYRPPLAGHTLLLWFGPILLLIGSLIGAFIVIHKRRQALK